MDETLYIKEWNRVFHYEAAIKGTVQWRRSPIHPSPRARLMATTRDGRDALCVFNAICDLVVRYKQRGVLVDDHGQPIDETLVHLSSGIPISIVRKGFQFLRSPQIGWLTTNPVDIQSTDDRRMIDDSSTDDRRKIDPEQNRTEQIRSEEDKTRQAPASVPKDLFSDELVRSALRGVGVSDENAWVILTHPNATRENLLHASAQMAKQMGGGRRFTHPHRMVMRIAWKEPTAKEKVAQARAHTGRQFDAARLKLANGGAA